jgi:hypothetical protein
MKLTSRTHTGAMSLVPGWWWLVAEALAFLQDFGVATPRGDDQDFDLRAPRDGPAGELLTDFDVRAPRDGPAGGLLD